MPLCSAKKNPDDKLNTLEELLLAVVLFSGFLTLADFNLAIFHPKALAQFLV